MTEAWTRWPRFAAGVPRARPYAPPPAIHGTVTPSTGWRPGLGRTGLRRPSRRTPAGLVPRSTHLAFVGQKTSGRCDVIVLSSGLQGRRCPTPGQDPGRGTRSARPIRGRPGLGRPHVGTTGSLAFSCRGRGVCPSCGAQRMAEVAAHLTDEVIPDRSDGPGRSETRATTPRGLSSPEARLVYRLPEPDMHDRQALRLTPLEPLARLARLVPPPTNALRRCPPSPSLPRSPGSQRAPEIHRGHDRMSRVRRAPRRHHDPAACCGRSSWLASTR